MGHAIGDVITDAATIDVAVEEVACVVVDAVYTTCITLLKSIIAVDDLVSVHTVRDIDPEEPSNMLFFCAVDWTQ